MDRDVTSSRIGLSILLVAMAMQGVTPDFRNLASSWLFRFVTTGSADPALGKETESLPDEDPGDVCTSDITHAGLRLQRDATGRPGAEFPPVPSSEHRLRSIVVAFHPPFRVAPGWDIIRSLCRFLC